MQVVVESDEQQMKINEVITKLKKEIEQISQKIDKATKQFRDVKTQRKEAFLGYFDGVAQSVS